MFVPGSNSARELCKHLKAPHYCLRDGNSLKTGARGDDPNGVIWAAGCQGGMKLKIPNPGVSGEASTAPLYERLWRSLTYKRAMRTDARTNTTARIVARAITAGDMVDCRLDAS